LATPRSIKPLLAAISDPDPNIRVAVVEALNGFRDSDVVASLILALKGPNQICPGGRCRRSRHGGRRDRRRTVAGRPHGRGLAVRKASGEALARLRDKRAVEPMLGLLNDPDQDVREARSMRWARFATGRRWNV